MIAETSTVQPVAWLYNQLKPLVLAQGWDIQLGDVGDEYFKDKPCYVMVWTSSDFGLQLRDHREGREQISVETLNVDFIIWAGAPKGYDYVYCLQSFLLTEIRKILGVSVSVGQCIVDPMARVNNGQKIIWSMSFDVPMPRYTAQLSAIVNDVILTQTDTVLGDGLIGDS